MTPEGAPVCCIATCTQIAVMVVRMLPRRLDEPLCVHTSGALSWPGIALACEVWSCHSTVHQQQIKQAAVSIISTTALGDEVAHRVLDAEVAE